MTGCRLCASPATILPGDDLPLCLRHWVLWLSWFVNGDEEPPCSAHLM